MNPVTLIRTGGIIVAFLGAAAWGYGVGKVERILEEKYIRSQLPNLDAVRYVPDEELADRLAAVEEELTDDAP